MARQAVKKLEKPPEPPNSGESELAVILDRAPSIRGTYGWIMGSVITLRAIGAVDKKRSLLGWSVVSAIALGLFQGWLKWRGYL